MTARPKDYKYMSQDTLKTCIDIYIDEMTKTDENPVMERLRMNELIVQLKAATEVFRSKFVDK